MQSRLMRTKKMQKKRKRIKITVLLILFALCIPTLIVPGCTRLTSIIAQMPELDLKAIEEQNEASIFYTSDGEMLTEYFSYENRIWTPLSEIPVSLQHAFIAVEDKRFYAHIGIDPIRIAGSFVNNLRGRSTQGGSTLTQQLIKLIFLTQEQTYSRKIQEALLSLKLERIYSKDQILEAYLNTIYLGQSNYGVKAAAIDYFGKENLSELTLKECALLACIANRPNANDPRKAYYGDTDTWDYVMDRSDMILSLMLQEEYISNEAYQTALKEKLTINEDAARMTLYPHPSYVEYAIYDAVEQLILLNGWQDEEDAVSKAEMQLYTGGLHITTAMDEAVQACAEETLYQWEDYPQIASDSDALVQACTAVVDNATGYLCAVVGSRTPPSAKRELNRAQALLMPGSAIKPITVYGPALNAGASPASIFHNIPAVIQGWDRDQAYPKNFGGSAYTGPITMREGLIDSVNIAAAQCLVKYVGFDQAADYLRQMEFDQAGISITGSGLALGTSDVSAVSMASAYATIANSGVYRKPSCILKIADRSGRVLLDNTETAQSLRIYSEASSWMLIDMLSDAVQYGTGKKARVEGMTIAGKTGTASDNKSVYFCGCSPYYSAAIWVGDDAGRSLASSAQGGTEAAPIFSLFMSEIHAVKGLSDRSIIQKSPESLGLKQYAICKVSGLLAGPSCPKEDIVVDWFIPGTQPQAVCKNHISAEICTASEKLPSLYCPEEAIQIKSFFILPEDSPYLQLSFEQIKRYIPEAADFETQAMLLNPGKATDDYCTVHTMPQNPFLSPTPSPAPDDASESSPFFKNVGDLFNELLPLQPSTPTPSPTPLPSPP